MEVNLSTPEKIDRKEARLGFRQDERHAQNPGASMESETDQANLSSNGAESECQTKETRTQQRPKAA